MSAPDPVPTPSPAAIPSNIVLQPGDPLVLQLMINGVAYPLTTITLGLTADGITLTADSTVIDASGA